VSPSPPRRGRDNRRPSRLIVGLGNPGRRYASTFHNAGFLAIDRLAVTLGIRLHVEGKLEYGIGDAAGEVIMLARPQTYMNLSGTAVAPWYRSHAESPGDLVVLHDELDIPLGDVRLKRGGGAGGHNGLRSLQTELSTPDFLRVRIGVGRPPPGWDAADYVLAPIPEESRTIFESSVASAADAVLDLLRDGFEKASTRWNQKRKNPAETRA
jgi:PTH1 family peptidyl-tRNA hydrolase